MEETTGPAVEAQQGGMTESSEIAALKAKIDELETANTDLQDQVSDKEQAAQVNAKAAADFETEVKTLTQAQADKDAEIERLSKLLEAAEKKIPAGAGDVQPTAEPKTLALSHQETLAGIRVELSMKNATHMACREWSEAIVALESAEAWLALRASRRKEQGVIDEDKPHAE